MMVVKGGMNTDGRRLDHKTLTDELRKRAMASGFTATGREAVGSGPGALGVNLRTVFCVG